MAARVHDAELVSVRVGHRDPGVEAQRIDGGLTHRAQAAPVAGPSGPSALRTDGAVLPLVDQVRDRRRLIPGGAGRARRPLVPHRSRRQVGESAERLRHWGTAWAMFSIATEMDCVRRWNSSMSLIAPLRISSQRQDNDGSFTYFPLWISKDRPRLVASLTDVDAAPGKSGRHLPPAVGRTGAQIVGWQRWRQIPLWILDWLDLWAVTDSDAVASWTGGRPPTPDRPAVPAVGRRGGLAGAGVRRQRLVRRAVALRGGRARPACRHDRCGAGHVPDVDLRATGVHVRTWSADVSGLTDEDVELARAVSAGGPGARPRRRPVGAADGAADHRHRAAGVGDGFLADRAGLRPAR